MKVKDIIEGLQIIERCRPETSSEYHLRAEHDMIYVGSVEWRMSESDKKRLEELGWDTDSDVDGYVTSV